MADMSEQGSPAPSPQRGRSGEEPESDKLILEREESYRKYVRLDLILKVVGLSLALAAIGIGFFVYRDRLFLLAGSAVSAIFLLLDRAARRLRQVALRELGELARLAGEEFRGRATSIADHAIALLRARDPRLYASIFDEPEPGGRRGIVAAWCRYVLAPLRDVPVSQIVVMIFGVGYYFFGPPVKGPPEHAPPAPPPVVRVQVDPIAFQPLKIEAEPLVAKLGPIRLEGVPVQPAAATRPPEGAKSGEADRPQPPCGGRFTILQLNDVYRVEGLVGGTLGGLARVRTVRKELEAAGRPVLVLHAGDMLSPSVMSKYLQAGPMIRCLNLLDGDPVKFDPYLIATFGNHEFDEDDPLTFLGRVAQSDFRWVSSNVAYCTAPGAPTQRLSDRLRNVHETICLDVGGVRVGVFGLTLDYQKPGYVSYVYHDPGDRHRIARDAIDRLRAEGARVIVALTHQELTEDIQLARTFPGEIDLIVGGHEHFSIQRKVGDTLITKADADARSVIVHDVQVDAGGRVSVGPTPRALDGGTPRDETVDAEVKRSEKALADAARRQTGRDLARRFGRAGDVELDGFEATVRGRETALGNFLADTIRDAMKADIAFINGGSIRLNDLIPAGGPITDYDLEAIFYYDNGLVSFKLSGQQILTILNNAVSKVHLGDGRFLHISGLNFCYHVGGSEDDPTYRIDRSEVRAFRVDKDRFEPIDPDYEYTIATLDYLWKRGFSDGFKVFSLGDGGTSPPEIRQGLKSFRAIVEARLADLERDGKPVPAKLERRIVRLVP